MTDEEQKLILNLWKEYLNGSEEAFPELYTVFFSDLMRYGVRLYNDKTVIEDLMQDIFVKLYMKKNIPADETKIRPFVYKSLKNSLYNYCIHQNKSVTFTEAQEYFDFHPGTADNMTFSEAYSDELLSLISGLSYRQKEIIYLRFVQDLDFDEIAEVLDMNKQSAYNLLSRSLEKIRKAQLTHSFLLYLSSL